MWLKRIGREWLVLSAAFVGAAFAIGDATGWLEKFGYEASQKWIVSAVFILFAIVVMVRLVRLQAQIDKRKIGITLDELIGEGNHILAILTDESWDAIRRHDIEMGDWATKIRKLIKPYGYENDWMTNTGLVKEEREDQEDPIKQNMAIKRNYMRLRIIRLREIREKLGD